jgi:hypothetical protein
MRHRLIIAVVAVIVAASTATLRAADLAGTWTAKFVTQVGDQDYTFTFAGSGAQATGTAKSTLLGETKLTNVKVEGDKVTFAEDVNYQDMPLHITYSGTFTGPDELKLTRVVIEGANEEAVARRSR